MHQRALKVAERQIALIQTINTKGKNCKGGSEDNVTFDNVTQCKAVLADETPFGIVTTIKATITDEVGGVAIPYAKVLEVKVTWTNRSGTENSLTLPVTVSKHTNLLT